MLTINGIPLEKSFVFSGGEVQIKLPKFPINEKENRIEVKTILNSSDKIMELILVKEALDHYYSCYYTKLICHYLPYARQDRRCADGEAFAGKVMVELLDNLGFSEIEIADVHNPDILQHFIRTKVTHIEMIDILSWNTKILSEIDTVIAPDRGALEKVRMIAEVFHRDWLWAKKKRDPETGKIEEILFDCEEYVIYEKIMDKNVLILDDICDGGGTFIGLSKLINEYYPRSLSLYVTHGIFSKGITPLSQAKIDTIYITDSFFVEKIHLSKFPEEKNIIDEYFINVLKM